MAKRACSSWQELSVECNLLRVETCCNMLFSFGFHARFTRTDATATTRARRNSGARASTTSSNTLQTGTHGKDTRGKVRAGPAANSAAFQRSGAAGSPALAALAVRHGRALHNVPGDDQCPFQLAELQVLAEHMRPSLKPSQGPTPRAEHIMAAILMTRDASLGARAACRMVPGVNEAAAKSRVANLAVKVRALLSSSAELSVALPEVAAPQHLPPHPCLRAGGAQPLRQAEPEEQQEDDLGLPPLTATRELPKATSPPPPPTDAENSDVERMVVEPFVTSCLP